jgi:glyoxylate reductase
MARLRAAADVEGWPEDRPVPRDVLEAGVRDADGLICTLVDRIDRALIESAPRLRVVSTMAVGFDNIDLAAAAARGIVVGNTPDVLTDATADVALGLMVVVARRLGEGYRDVLGGRWGVWGPSAYLGVDLEGQTLGVVGFGRIGQNLARKCHAAFGMKVVYTRRSADDPGPAAPEAPDATDATDARRPLDARRVELDELLATSDFVSLHVDLNPSTRALIGARELALMKPHAVLVNTARGQVVDQAALYAALRAGRLFGAGLDVAEVEPMRADDPLLSLPNCVVSPHVGSATRRTRLAMAEIAVDNVLAGVCGEPLRAAVATR